MDLKTQKRQYFYICMVYLFYYAGYTAYFSFLTVFLKGEGYGTSDIGLVMTCISLANLVSQPLLGQLGDTRFSIKRIVAVGMCVTIPGAFLLGASAGVFLLALGSILLVAFFDYSMIGLLDTWTNLSKEENPRINYSVARGMGSFSSAVAALLIGDALARFGNDKIFLFHGVFMAAAFVFVLLFREVPCAGKARSGERRESMGEALRSLFRNRKYRCYIIAIFMVNMGWRSIITYLPVILLDFGGNSSHQGIAMAVCTIGIAPVMFVYPRLLKRFGIERMIQAGYLLTIVRVFSICLVQNLWMMVWFQAFEAVSFGILQPSMIEYVTKATPAKNRALAVTVAAAVQMALCGTVGNYLAGIFLEYFNFHLLFFAFGCIGTAGFLVLRRSVKA